MRNRRLKLSSFLLIAFGVFLGTPTGYQIDPPVPLPPRSTVLSDDLIAKVQPKRFPVAIAPSTPPACTPEQEEPLLANTKPEHLVGIIGGIGPAASIRFQQLVLEKDRQKKSNSPNYCLLGESCGFLADATYTPYLLYHNPHIPNNNLAVLGQGPPSLQALIESAQALQRAGATEVAFACTTAYHWKAAIEEFAQVPVLDLLDQVAKRVVAKEYRRVGLLDVDGTIQSGAFQRALERRGIEVVLPDVEDQQTIMSAVAKIKADGFVDQLPQSQLNRVAQHLVRKENVPSIILGCTEIATALGGGRTQPVEFIDTLEVLADCIVHPDQLLVEGLGGEPTVGVRPLPLLDYKKSTMLLAQ